MVVTSNDFYGVFRVVSNADHSVARTGHFLIKSDQSIIVVCVGVIFARRNSSR